MKFSIAFIVQATSAQLIHGTDISEVESVVIDSRDLMENALFVAIKGERLDGHRFVASAVEKGASAVMVHEHLPDVGVPQLKVDDTTIALGKLAAAHLHRLDVPVVAVTGSSGKTTTRNLIVEALAGMGRIHSPKKNFNNHIGVPLTALAMDGAVDIAVFELGCSDFNEIAYLTNIVCPNVALVTNVGPAHLENLKDLDGVAVAKGELFSSMPRAGTALVNLDDERVKSMPISVSRQLTYGMAEDADIRLMRRTPHLAGQDVEILWHGVVTSFTLPMYGQYNAINALAAFAAAVTMGQTPERAAQNLSVAQAVDGRLKKKEAGDFIVIDDTYNANPGSMAASLEVLQETVAESNRFVVLGDMLELGELSEQAHFNMGKLVAAGPVQGAIFCGAMMKHAAEGAKAGGMAADTIIWVGAENEIDKKLPEILKKGATLLIKGSRGMNLDRVVRRLVDDPNAKGLR